MNEKQQKVKELIQEGSERLLEALKQGKSERLERYLAFMAHFHHYSYGNQMLIYMQCPSASRVAGYKTWQKLGCQVRQGEKGIAIFAPMTFKKQEEDGDKVETITRFRLVHVFDQSQLVEPPQEEFFTPLADDANALLAAVQQAVTAEGIEVEERNLFDGVQGASTGGKIILQQGRDSRSTVMTLIHEWAHERLHHHESQTDRKTRECQAEAISFVVCHHFGLENPFSADYLLSYGNTAEELTANLSVIQAVSAEMIEGIAKQLEAGYERERRGEP